MGVVEHLGIVVVNQVREMRRRLGWVRQIARVDTVPHKLGAEERADDNQRNSLHDRSNQLTEQISNDLSHSQKAVCCFDPAMT